MTESQFEDLQSALGKTVTIQEPEVASATQAVEALGNEFLAQMQTFTNAPKKTKSREETVMAHKFTLFKEAAAHRKAEIQEEIKSELRNWNEQQYDLVIVTVAEQYAKLFSAAYPPVKHDVRSNAFKNEKAAKQRFDEIKALRT